VSDINLKGLDHVICLTIGPTGAIQFRHYAIIMKKSGTRVPLVELEEIGPSIDLIWRRTQFGAENLRNETLSVSRQIQPKKEKNVSYNQFRDKMGTVHLEKQDPEHIHDKVKKPKALRKRKSNILLEDSADSFNIDFHQTKRRKTL